MKRVFLSLLLVVLPMVGLTQEVREPQGIITVTGTAEVFASPDEALVRLGIQQQASTAAEAQSKANGVIQSLLKALAGLNVDKKDIQTSQMRLMPIYSVPKPGEPQKITGYQAQDVLAVRLTDFGLVGKVIDAGTTAGVNTIDGIDFNLRNAREPRAAAYKEAVADARSKADAVAEALGLKVGSVYDVHTDASGYVPPPRTMEAMRVGFAAGTPVEPGQMQVSVTVTIRYKLQDPKQPGFGA